ncbi:MAG: TIGR01458 family HAD-type hydrolase [Thermoleophilaceae bacterium]|nr:TIGR01458 family HAD-type hydrolase [Thermoleophilaceae bacterium]
MSPLALRPDPAVLLDIDGVLHVGDEPIPGAVEALTELREIASGLRLVTNTTSRSRAEVAARLREIGIDASVDEMLTPAAMAVQYCATHDISNARLYVSDSLREDLTGLNEAGADQAPDVVVLGDIADRFNADTMNEIFRLLMDGARLMALQHNRYWQHGDGLMLDVGAWAAALEYATGRTAITVGKPSNDFYNAALASLGVDANSAIMVGDDIEADVNGAQTCGIQGVLVRTGKYRDGIASDRGFGPAAIIDSIADLPALLRS